MLSTENITRSESRKWARIKVPAELLKELTRREDARPMRDMMIWFGLLAAFAFLTISSWGSWWAIIPLYAYSVLYSTGSQSREHETGHGTAFKTKKYNQFFFEVTSFMVLRETFLRAKSHDIHHKHTILTDKDPEIVTPTPPNILSLSLNLFMIERAIKGLSEVSMHALNRVTQKDIKNGRTKLPEGALFKARLWVLILLSTVILSFYFSSWLPVLLIGPLPMIFGGTLRHLFALSQHVGLAQNVYDHRMNTRTIYLGPILGFLYINMQYHLEHHLYPNVPYYNLPALHEAIKDRCPPAYDGLWSVLIEMFPALLKQRAEPAYYIERQIPKIARQNLA